MNRDEIAELKAISRVVIESIDAFNNAPRNGGNSSASNINVHAGGTGLWICSTFCALCLLSSFFTLYVVSEIKQNDRDQGNQLNAIYMIAPSLKPNK